MEPLQQPQETGSVLGTGPATGDDGIYHVNHPVVQLQVAHLERTPNPACTCAKGILLAGSNQLGAFFVALRPYKLKILHLG